MAFVIGASCIDVMDKSCIEECPVDCIYEGGRKLYIQPTECIDCGACETVCPVEAITADRIAVGNEKEHRVNNAEFFEITLPGQDVPLGSPGGAIRIGRLGIDTPLVAGVTATQT